MTRAVRFPGQKKTPTGRYSEKIEPWTPLSADYFVVKQKSPRITPSDPRTSLSKNNAHFIVR